MNEDARISQAAACWHFLRFVEDTRWRLHWLRDALIHSHMPDGNSHEEWIAAFSAEIEKALTSAEQSLKRQKLESGHDGRQ